MDVAPVTTPASTFIVPSRTIADPAVGFRLSAAADVIVNAPALVDHVEAAADVIVNAPAEVAIVPASVNVISPSKNKSCHAADAEPRS
jgi:hypothetical protein